MLIIDPEMNCARIYTEDSTAIIKGTPKDVCQDLADRLYARDYYGNIKQIAIPSIVEGGVGDSYIDILNAMGVITKSILPKHINNFLPKLMSN